MLLKNRTSPPKVSIIVPIYKVEHYIERCAHSLFQQTFGELEYVFVNDCTPDKSIDILEKVISDYPERKNQVIILHHQNNRGVSAARNTGLINASGNYFIYVDSDDYIESTMVQEFYTKAIDDVSDIVWSDFVVNLPQDSNKSLYRKQNVPDSGALCIMNILSGTLHAGLWNKLLKRSICITNNIQFPQDVNVCEDIVFIILYLLHVEQVSYLPKALYHYVQNPGSITITPTRQSFESEFQVVKILEKTLPDREYGKYLLMYKARIRRRMLFSGIFTCYEYYDFYPESSVYMYFNTGLIGHLAVWLSNIKLFGLARVILNFRYKICRNN